MSDEIVEKVAGVIPTLIVAGATLEIYDRTVGKHSHTNSSKPVELKKMRFV